MLEVPTAKPRTVSGRWRLYPPNAAVSCNPRCRYRAGRDAASRPGSVTRTPRWEPQVELPRHIHAGSTRGWHMHRYRWPALLAWAAVSICVAGCGITSAGTTSTRAAAAPSAVPATASAASGSIWTDEVVWDMRMVSATSGWGELERGASGNPLLARTTDGAATWHVIQLSGACRGAGSPGLPSGPSLNDAWVTAPGLGGESVQTITVCHSTDAGQHWIAVGNFRSAGIAGLPQFIDATHGWVSTIVANGMHSESDVRLFRTTDGGQRWVQVAASAVAPGQSFGGLPAACGGQFKFVTATTGWYVGGCMQGGAGVAPNTPSANYVAVTHDGGTHWKSVDLPHPRLEQARAGCLVGAACYYSILIARPGLVELFSGGRGAPAGSLYRSTDGQTWTVQALPLSTIEVGSFDGTRLLQLSDTTAQVYASSDSGRSWNPLRSNLPGPLFQGGGPYFSDARIAFVFVGPRQLYETENGGQKWRRIQVALAKS